MDRAEAEAIYDSGRETCVQFILDLAGRVAQHEDRLRRLEEHPRQDSRTSSKPPSIDPPKTRAERRAEARAKAKELMRREGERREAGGQGGHRGAGRELRPEDQVDERGGQRGHVAGSRNIPHGSMQVPVEPAISTTCAITDRLQDHPGLIAGCGQVQVTVTNTNTFNVLVTPVINITAIIGAAVDPIVVIIAGIVLDYLFHAISGK